MTKYRVNTAPPDQYWQSYCQFEHKDGRCEYFIKNRGGDVNKSKDI